MPNFFVRTSQIGYANRTMNSPASRLPKFSVLLLAAYVLQPCVQAASAPQITNYFRSGDLLTLGWTDAGPGTAYTVQYRDSLTGKLWLMPITDQPWPTPFTQWSDTQAAGIPTRFYRVLAVPAAERGKVISSTLTRTMSTFEIQFLLNMGGVPITAQYSVGLYKVVYETITPIGARTRASGALLLPQGTGRALPLVTYQHGTITQTNKAPSSMDLYGEVTIGIAWATTGYAAAVPDFLGLGDSPGFHPYHHARSEATACVDMLRAVRTLCATNGFPLTNRLFLCGYSQGGHATMALCRELEAYHTNEFAITACAPMAGAYDLSGVTTDDVLSGHAQPNPYYFAYLLAAYQDVYHLAPSLADLLTTPYNTTLPPLLAGNASGGQINTNMPANPAEILKPEYLTAFRNDPVHPLRLALQDNDVHDWTPRAPLRMYHCQADQDVIYLNSQVALASFQGRGATQVQLIDPLPTAGHGDCVLPSLILAKAWFDSLR